MPLPCVLETILVDCYGEDEEYTSVLMVIVEPARPAHRVRWSSAVPPAGIGFRARRQVDYAELVATLLEDVDV